MLLSKAGGIGLTTNFYLLVAALFGELNSLHGHRTQAEMVYRIAAFQHEFSLSDPQRQKF